MDGATMAAEEHRLQKLFHELDANKDGRIDIHELTEGLHKIGYSHITEEQILVRFKYFFSNIKLQHFKHSPKFWDAEKSDLIYRHPKKVILSTNLCNIKSHQETKRIPIGRGISRKSMVVYKGLWAHNNF